MIFQRKSMFYRGQGLTYTSSGNSVKHHIHRLRPNFEIGSLVGRDK